MKRIKFILAAVIISLFFASCSPRSSSGSNLDQQDNVHSVTIDAQITSVFLDHDMVPVTFQKKALYAYFSDADYKLAVEVNAAMEKGNIVLVTLKPEKNWLQDWEYRITGVIILTKEEYNNPCNLRSPNFNAEKCSEKQDSISDYYSPDLQKVKSTSKNGNKKSIKGNNKCNQDQPTTYAVSRPTFPVSYSDGGGVTIYINCNGATVNIGERDNGHYPIFDPGIPPTLQEYQPSRYDTLR